METPQEIAQKVRETEQAEFSRRFARMDEDYKLQDMIAPPNTAYEASVRTKTKAHESDIEIVSNDLRNFLDETHSILSSAERHIAVRLAEDTGEDKREAIGKQERILTFAFEQADKRLRKLLFSPLQESISWYFLVRGWAGARILVYKEKIGREIQVLFDFSPLDPRYLVYQVGKTDILWSAYKCYKSKAQLNSEFAPDLIRGEVNKEQDNLVIDYWKNQDGKIWNAVVCENIFLKEFEEFDIPSMPIIIQPVPMRPPVPGELHSYGESIFAPARNINAARNRFLSMVASQANKLANQPLLHYTDEMGSDLKTTTNVAGGVMELVKGHDEVVASPMKEISPTVIDMLRFLNTQMDASTLPSLPMESPPSSGTRFALALEEGKRIFNPQLRAISNFYADMCDMIEKQLIAGKIKVNVEYEKDLKYFKTMVTPIDLKKPHIIKVDFTAQTPWSRLDTAQLADMLRRAGVPEEWLWEYVYKFPDPKGMKDLRFIEMAEHSPKGAMLQAIKAALRYGRVDEAKMLIEDMHRVAVQEEAEQAQPAIPAGEAAPAEEEMARRPEVMP